MAASRLIKQRKRTQRAQMHLNRKATRLDEMGKRLTIATNALKAILKHTDAAFDFEKTKDVDARPYERILDISNRAERALIKLGLIRGY